LSSTALGVGPGASGLSLARSVTWRQLARNATRICADALFELVIDRAQIQIVLRGLEGRFDFDGPRK
jgi:hypothetical protein